jgi:2-polyprenyl-6-methoxyphenol hydroxylase-like FAD-dependent oxidoreductase
VYLFTGSRPQLELLVRRRVLADPRIELVAGAEVTGLSGTADRVTGVTVRERGREGREGGAGREGGGGERRLTASLVVDASGRGSKAQQWLTALGAEPPAEDYLDTGLAYTSRLYQPIGLGSPDCLGYYVVPAPDQVYSAAVLPLEDGRMLVTLAGLRGCEPPTDPEGFTEFARRMPHPFVHDWLIRAEPVTAPFGFRNTSNLRRRYDLPGGHPAGFLAVGDALCTVNPIYGQGMTVAAQGALALRDALSHPRRRPGTRQVQRAVLRAARHAWDISAGADKTMPGAVGSAAGLRAADRASACASCARSRGSIIESPRFEVGVPDASR